MTGRPDISEWLIHFVHDRNPMPGEAEAELAAQVMKDLVDRTLTVVRSLH